MAKIYRLQREDKYADGLPFWNTIKSSRNKEKLVKESQSTNAHTRVIEEDDED